MVLAIQQILDEYSVGSLDLDTRIRLRRSQASTMGLRVGMSYVHGNFLKLYQE